MAPELTNALITVQDTLIEYFDEHPEKDMHPTMVALQTIKRNLDTLPAVAAMYHEGIESLTSREAYNASIDAIIEEAGVEWPPLLEFMERLKEPEVGGRCDVRG